MCRKKCGVKTQYGCVRKTDRQTDGQACSWIGREREREREKGVGRVVLGAGCWVERGKTRKAVFTCGWGEAMNK